MNTRRAFLRSLFGGAAVAAVAPFAVAELMAYDPKASYEALYGGAAGGGKTEMHMWTTKTSSTEQLNPEVFTSFWVNCDGVVSEHVFTRNTSYGFLSGTPAMHTWSTCDVKTDRPDLELIRKWQKLMNDLESRVSVDDSRFEAHVAYLRKEFQKAHIINPAYLEKLKKLKPEIRKQLLEGKWT